MFATYLSIAAGLILAAMLFGLAAVWPLCRVADRADRAMGLK
jgi:hypothetical protein